jgi:hypothetical protein
LEVRQIDTLAISKGIVFFVCGLIGVDLIGVDCFELLTLLEKDLISCL